MPHAAHRDLPLLHRFQQRRLRFGRRAVDFVGQDDVREDRAFEEPPLAGPRAAVLFDDLRARDVRRHQVGRELNPAEGQIQRPSQRADHQRLGQPRHALQQAVPAAEQRDQQLLDDLVLADNHLGQLLLDLPASLLQAMKSRRLTR